MDKKLIINEVIFVYKTAPSFGIDKKKDKIFFQASMEMHKKNLIKINKKNLKSNRQN